MISQIFEERFQDKGVVFAPVVPSRQGDKLVRIDFTAENKELSAEILNNTVQFSRYVTDKLEQAGATYGIGGYNEHRTIYSRSDIFGTSQGEESRRLHLGIDIWGPAHTSVYAPLEGTVHSFAFNDHFGDYGATLILQHELAGIIFHSLYGHLSLASIQEKKEGQSIEKGEHIATFGEMNENGNWPPHLHFQLILDMQHWKGDYPGVCRFSEKESYLQNCPDPDIILNMMKQAG